MGLTGVEDSTKSSMVEIVSADHNINVGDRVLLKNDLLPATIIKIYIDYEDNICLNCAEISGYILLSDVITKDALKKMLW